jgi:drug/metabolite transporter (DMT)-like permease
MAILSAINGIAFTFCAFKSLDYINLSLFSLFSMLGGMVLPFFQGIIFYSEGVTVAKCLCVVLICVALALTVQKGEKKRGTVFYIGIFVLNGMSGVLSKLFNEGNYPKTNAAGFSIWIAVCTLMLSGVIWLILELRDRYVTHAVAKDGHKPSKKILWQSYGIGALQGSINKVANFLLVIALMHVDASVQYPMVTGGTMIVSTLICFLGDKKPSRKELVSVALAFAAMLSLFLIPV